MNIFRTRCAKIIQDPHPDRFFRSFARSLETPELNAICEEWKIEQLKAQGVIVESDTGRLVEGRRRRQQRLGSLGNSLGNQSGNFWQRWVLMGFSWVFRSSIEGDILCSTFTEGTKT